MLRRLFFLAAIAAISAVSMLAADVAGKWTATIDTPVGQMNYTYEFKVDGAKLTGSANSNMSKSEIKDGKVDGDNITFVETMKVMDMEIVCTYKGKISGDEIKFSRQVGDFATEEFAAKRSK